MFQNRCSNNTSLLNLRFEPCSKGLFDSNLMWRVGCALRSDPTLGVQSSLGSFFLKWNKMGSEKTPWIKIAPAAPNQCCVQPEDWFDELVRAENSLLTWNPKAGHLLFKHLALAVKSTAVAYLLTFMFISWWHLKHWTVVRTVVVPTSSAGPVVQISSTPNSDSWFLGHVWQWLCHQKTTTKCSMKHLKSIFTLIQLCCASIGLEWTSQWAKSWGCRHGNSNHWFPDRRCFGFNFGRSDS